MSIKISFAVLVAGVLVCVPVVSAQDRVAFTPSTMGRFLDAHHLAPADFARFSPTEVEVDGLIEEATHGSVLRRRVRAVALLAAVPLGDSRVEAHLTRLLANGPRRLRTQATSSLLFRAQAKGSLDETLAVLLATNDLAVVEEVIRVIGAKKTTSAEQVRAVAATPCRSAPSGQLRRHASLLRLAERTIQRHKLEPLRRIRNSPRGD